MVCVSHIVLSPRSDEIMSFYLTLLMWCGRLIPCAAECGCGVLSCLLCLMVWCGISSRLIATTASITTIAATNAPTNTHAMCVYVMCVPSRNRYRHTIQLTRVCSLLRCGDVNTVHMASGDEMRRHDSPITSQSREI